MEYIYAALLLHKAGKEITEERLIAILNAADIDINENRVKALIASLEGVDIEEAISKSSIVSMNLTSVSGSQPSSETQSTESKVEEKEKEPDHSEEDGMAGLGALFG